MKTPQRKPNKVMEGEELMKKAFSNLKPPKKIKAVSLGEAMQHLAKSVKKG